MLPRSNVGCLEAWNYHRWRETEITRTFFRRTRTTIAEEHVRSTLEADADKKQILIRLGYQPCDARLVVGQLTFRDVIDVIDSSIPCDSKVGWHASNRCDRWRLGISRHPISTIVFTNFNGSDIAILRPTFCQILHSQVSASLFRLFLLLFTQRSKTTRPFQSSDPPIVSTELRQVSSVRRDMSRSCAWNIRNADNTQSLCSFVLGRCPENLHDRIQSISSDPGQLQWQFQCETGR